MAYPHTRSRARGEVADSDIEPSDTAPSAATSPLSISVRPNVETVEGPESVSTKSAGPVSAPTLSLSAGSHPFSGSHGQLGSAGPSQVAVSALGYPSGQADPPDSMRMHIGGQMSTSLATGIARAKVHPEPITLSDRRIYAFVFAAAAGHRECRTAAAGKSYT